MKFSRKNSKNIFQMLFGISSQFSGIVQTCCHHGSNGLRQRQDAVGRTGPCGLGSGEKTSSCVIKGPNHQELLFIKPFFLFFHFFKKKKKIYFSENTIFLNPSMYFALLPTHAHTK
jgi:hypothetical protein